MFFLTIISPVSRWGFLDHGQPLIPCKKLLTFRLVCIPQKRPHWWTFIMAPFFKHSTKVFHRDLTGAKLLPGIPARFRTSDASAVRWCSGPVSRRLRLVSSCPSDALRIKTSVKRGCSGRHQLGGILALQRASGSIVGQQVSKLVPIYSYSIYW